MKQFIVSLVLAFLIISCETETKKEKDLPKLNYPAELGKVFDQHGGLKKWKSLKTLSFNKGEESHTVDLQSRKTIVKAPKYSLGFDGKNVWVSDLKTFKGNPSFYHNLYFYFYAMPFVLADDGIIYEKSQSITYKGTTYPGIKISYEANIGTSPDDNYILYYHPKTYQMEWLAYTVTFKSKKPSDRYNMIKYGAWEKVGDVVLPKAITWYKQDENGTPTEPRGNPIEFTLPLASKKKLTEAFYQRPTE